MYSAPLYLRPNIQVEPLIDQWYAWPHLLPPATAARNLTERHLDILNSYITSPEVHAKAAQNPLEHQSAKEKFLRQSHKEKGE